MSGALLALLVVAAGAAMPPELAPLFDPAGQVVVAATPVPAPARRVGEVRLVRRGAAAVVQTLLDTTLLPRVVAEIAAKERANWPAGRAGHDDAERYVAALERVAGELRAERARNPRRRRRRLRLLIEFVLAERQAAVAVSGWRPGDAGTIHAAAPRLVLQPSRDYVRGNVRLIAADAFRVAGAALDALLAPLPHASAPARETPRVSVGTEE